MHARPFGPDRSFLTLVPDYLAGVKIEKLGQLCAACIARRDVFLLESEHTAARVIPVETQVRLVYDRVCEKKQVHFSDFVTNQDDPHLIVVTFLAILELFKRNMVSLSQDELFGDIAICVEEGANRQILEGDTEFDSVIEDA